MKHLESLALILGTALLTAVVAAPVIGPGFLRAEGESVEDIMLDAAPPSSLPVEAGGLVIDLKTDREKYVAGQKPVLTITAKNGKKETVCQKVTVHLYSQEPMSFLVRSMPMPEEVVTKEIPLELKGESSSSLTFDTGLTLVAGKLITITVQVGDTHYSAGGIAVPAAPAAAPIQQSEQN